MDSAVKAKWIQALRSGEYRKGRGALRPTRDTFCCLGVLCDLYAKETGRGSWSGNCSDFEFTANDPETGTFDRDTALLPAPVQLWAELSTNGGIAIDGPMSGKAAELPYYNDDQGLPFDQLADLIEKHA